MTSSAIGRTTRTGILLVLAGAAVFVLWAALAPLDEGVPTAGAIVVDTKRKTVQHLTGGIVDKVLVREAQQVNAGDVLLELNAAAARANYESARQRYLSVRATQGRLQAEQAQLARVAFHPDVLAGREDAAIAAHLRTEEQLFASRREALRYELAAMDEAIRAEEEAAAGFAAQLASREQQLGFIREEREGTRGLVADGYAPRNKLLELERMDADMSANVSALRAGIARSARTRAELVSRREQRRQEYQRDVATQLAEIQRGIVADAEKFTAAREELERTLIRAPVAGSVVGIANQTVGGVIQAGARIMDIVPKEEAYILETRVPPHLVDRVQPGQLADIRFSAFARSPQLVIEGRLLSLSADVIADSANGPPYFLARLEVTPKGRKDLGERQLVPGMPAEAVIKIGERTMLNYLLAPLIRRLAQGMKEA